MMGYDDRRRSRSPRSRRRDDRRHRRQSRSRGPSPRGRRRSDSPRNRAPSPRGRREEPRDHRPLEFRVATTGLADQARNRDQPRRSRLDEWVEACSGRPNASYAAFRLGLLFRSVSRPPAVPAAKSTPIPRSTRANVVIIID